MPLTTDKSGAPHRVPLDRRASLAGALSLLALISAAAAVPAVASTPAGGTGLWTFVGPAGRTSNNGIPVASVTLENHANVNLGVAILVLRDSGGRTVYYTTSTIDLGLGTMGTVYLVVGGVAPGSYTAKVFVMSLSGVPLSNSSSFAFPIT